ncbi:hypothetical protein ACQJ18_26000 [Priestia megaterium]|uniref:hypothetical protein n=1 Tax=Priestia megaterium TaxID=1404 RepID=UPI003D05970A
MSGHTYFLLLDQHVEKDELHKITIENDFKEYKNQRQENSYLWKGEKYETTRGCYFSFGHNAFIEGADKKYKTVCAASVIGGASYADVKKQFSIIESIKNVYGGEIFDPINNSWGFRENEIPPKLSKTEIACGIVYVRFKVRVSRKAADYLIEEVNPNHIWFDFSIDMYDYPDSLVNNNKIMNELITTFEVFLKNFFKKYLETNKSAYEKFVIDCKSEKQLNDNEKFETHMKKYSFQNLKDLNKVYKKYIDFNLKQEVLNIEMVPGKEDTKIGYILGELLKNRHSKSHDDIHNTELTKAKVIEYRTVMETFGREFIGKFMERKNLKLLIEYELGY